LFRESIFLWIRKPKLKIDISPKPPDCNVGPIILKNNVSSQVCFLRIWVSNEGKTTAKNVQVFAAKLFRKNASDKYIERTNFQPMNLLWSHTGSVFSEGIAPKMGQHCELGIILPPGVLPPNIPPAYLAHLNNNKTSLIIETQVKPFTGTSNLECGNYQILIRVAAENVEPKEYKIEINLTGVWFENELEMLSKGIGLNIYGV
jgi:hypothetical protein